QVAPSKIWTFLPSPPAVDPTKTCDGVPATKRAEVASFPESVVLTVQVLPPSVDLKMFPPASTAQTSFAVAPTARPWARTSVVAENDAPLFVDLNTPEVSNPE